MRIIKKISKSLTPKEQYLEKYGKHFTIKLADFAVNRWLIPMELINIGMFLM